MSFWLYCGECCKVDCDCPPFDHVPEPPSAEDQAAYDLWQDEEYAHTEENP